MEIYKHIPKSVLEKEAKRMFGSSFESSGLVMFTVVQSLVNKGWSVPWIVYGKDKVR